jgi:hypothetical protein
MLASGLEGIATALCETHSNKNALINKLRELNQGVL